MKLCVDPLSMSTIKSWLPIWALILIVLGVDHPVSVWREISGSGSSSFLSFVGFSSVTSSQIIPWLSVWLSNNNSWGPRHVCPAINLSLQLKQSPCARLRCISSQVNRFTEEESAVLVGGGSARAGRDGRANFLCRMSCSSFMRVKFMASFSVLSLNIQIAFEISDFSPPINVPIRAFCV